jgi:hypothetical protein
VCVILADKGVDDKLPGRGQQIVPDKINMEMQALSITCQHLNTYASTELSQMRSEIIALESKILDLQMELCIFRALYKVWKAFASSLRSFH